MELVKTAVPLLEELRDVDGQVGQPTCPWGGAELSPVLSIQDDTFAIPYRTEL